jgi:hypothetical protein
LFDGSGIDTPNRAAAASSSTTSPFPPLMPVQQLGRFLRRHAEHCAGRGGGSDAAILQHLADRQP